MHNEGLRNLYCSPSIIKKVKIRKKRSDGHVKN
jgi:hypothetical protein